MSKILVTGITGLVGSAFTTELLRRNHDIQIVALVRNGNRNTNDKVRENIRDQMDFDGDTRHIDSVLARIKVIDGDITDLTVLDSKTDELKGLDSVFHCAADVNLGKDVDGKTFLINYKGTENLLNFARKRGIRSFHYVSTAYVAGKHVGTVPEDGLVATDFNNSYEKSKFEAEKLVRAAGIPFTIYRPSIVVGRLSDGKIRKPLAFYRLLEFLGKLKRHHCSKHGLKPSEWVDIPLRLLAYPSELVYFVPIDYVQKTISDLFVLPVENKSYHITGDSPVFTKWIEKVFASTLKVRGVTVLENIPHMSIEEKMVHRFIGDLLPYFSSKIKFDVSNVEKALGKSSLDWKFGEKGLTTIMGSFYRPLIGD